MRALLLFAMLLLPARAAAGTEDVDPFIGTGGPPTATGNVFPGATRPFGFVRLSPDTERGALLGWLTRRLNLATSGYLWSMTHVRGFSHTRLSGAGVKEGGLLPVMPGGGSRRFSHAAELAVPGFYEVALDGGIRAELTATAHVGVHRYTFDGDGPAHVTLASGKTLRIAAGNAGFDGEAVAVGAFSRAFGGVHAFFAGTVDPPFREAALDADGAADLTLNGRAAELRIAFSLDGIEDARAKLRAETSGRTFADLRAEAQADWAKRLAAVEVEAVDAHVRRIFYTALYHAEIMPTDLGRTGEGYTPRSDFSLWDTFRAVHPLLELVAPDVQRDSIRSLDALITATGELPLWPAVAGDARAMIGEPAAPVMADAWAKGERGFDAARVVRLLRERQVARGRDQAVSRALDEAWADAAGATLAAALGDDASAKTLAARAESVKALWNPATMHFQAKDGEGWQTPFFPHLTTFVADALFFGHGARGFTEGSAAQWRWAMPWSRDGLRGLFGGGEAMAAALEGFLAGAGPRGEWIPSADYWHGNEHDLHAIYLFDDAGRPDLTQKWARWALSTRYSAAPEGLDGQDDAGALSAWYVFSALGFYPRAGSTEYWVGAPIVSRAVLHLADHDLVIVADRQAPSRRYLSSVSLDGVRLCEPYLQHAKLLAARELRFTMEDTAAPQGGFACRTGGSAP